MRDRLHLDQKVWVRERLDRDGGARRPVVVEELTVDLVVGGEIFHIDEEGRDFDQVAEPGPHAAQDFAQIFDQRARLRANVVSDGARGVGHRAGMLLSDCRALVPDTKSQSPTRLICG